MSLKKMRFYLAGAIAFLLGMPLTEKVFAGTSDIIDSSLDLGFSIANASDGS